MRLTLPGSVVPVEEKVEAAERVMDLLIALLNTRTRMSKAQIRRAVRGYHGDARAFERTFERDKDLLRGMGIPIIVERDAVHEDDVGYRIDVESWALTPVTFTPEEIGVLSLAARVYNDAQWRTVAGRGVTKVRSHGPGTHEEPPPVTLTLRAPEGAFDVLQEAVATRTPVAFDYVPLRSPKARRRLQPWRVLARNRAWYVVGHDVDRDAPRAFRLSRIAGAVRLAGPPASFDVPADVDVGALLDGPATAPESVTVAVAPDRAQLLRARGQVVGHASGRDVVELVTTEPHRLADEVAAYGPDAVLLTPAEQRERILRALAALVEVGDGH